MKKIFSFKLIIILFLIIMFIGIFIPNKVKALNDAYFKPDRFDEAEGYDDLENLNVINRKNCWFYID